MHKKSTFKRQISILFILAVLISGVITVLFIFSSGKTTNHRYIPSTANRIITIDGKMLFKKSASSIILKNDEQEVAKLIHDIISEPSDKSTMREAGIDFLSDIIFFTDFVGKAPINGLLLNLSNEEAFNLYVVGLSDKQHFGFAKNKVGVLIFKSNNSSITNNELSKYAAALFDAAPSNYVTNEDEVITYSYKETRNNKDAAGRITCSLTEQKIILSGQLTVSAEQEAQTSQLKPDGFHLSTSLIPKWINDSLHKTLNTSASIRSLSLNYFQATIEETEKIHVSPQLDMCLSFSDSIDVNELFNNLIKKEIIDSANTKNIYIGQSSYYHHPIDEKTLYIGIHPFDSAKQNKTTAPLIISGNPEYLTKVGGTGIIRRLLTIIPAYSSSQYLASTISSINVTTNSTQNNTYNLSGSIDFKDEHRVLPELIRFLLTGQFIQ